MITDLKNLRDAIHALEEKALKDYKGAMDVYDFAKAEQYDNIVFHLESIHAKLNAAIASWESNDEFREGP